MHFFSTYLSTSQTGVAIQLVSSACNRKVTPLIESQLKGFTFQFCKNNDDDEDHLNLNVEAAPWKNWLHFGARPPVTHAPAPAPAPRRTTRTITPTKKN